MKQGFDCVCYYILVL